MPFAFGLSDDGKAVEKINSRILLDFGVSACENIPSGGKKYQWGFPNSWAPHTYFAYTANKLTGNAERAKEIAFKYLNNVEGEFHRSGKLFEKYDAACGGKATVNEYGTPEMLGWTKGNNLINTLISNGRGLDFSMPFTTAYSGLDDTVIKKYIEDSKNIWEGQTDAVPVFEIGSTIGTHVGPGAVAVAFFEKE